MRILPMLLLFLVVWTGLLLAQSYPNFPARSICEVRTNANADCRADGVDDSVCVSGIVVAWKHFGGRGPGAIVDPETGCAISIFDITSAPDVPIGARVQVCGWVGPSNGLDELVDEPAADGTPDPAVTVLDNGPLPYPCPEIRSTTIANLSAAAESLESFCVEICGTFAGTGNFVSNNNYVFTDGFGQNCTVRIDGDTDIDGTPIPAASVRIRGVLQQFDGGMACTGYQVLPRSLADLTPDECILPVEQKSWGQVKTLFRDDD